MCDRYRIRADLQEVKTHLPDLIIRTEITDRFNVAPGQPMPLIRRLEDGSLVMEDFIWGLPPHRITDPTAGPVHALNHHTAATWLGHRSSYLYRRCLIPCHGFYAWQQATKTRRVPWFLSYPAEALMMMAGLWEDHPTNAPTFTLLTTMAPKRVMWVHDRFPILLPPDAWRTWLDPQTTMMPLANLVHDSHVRPNRDLQQWRVTSRMTDPAFEDPAAIIPLTARRAAS